MKIKYLLLPLIFITSCKEDSTISIKSNSEVFNIICGNNYELTLKDQDILKIGDNTFDCGTVDSFQLTINYIKNKKDIILSGIQTISQDGSLLESAGMVNLDFPNSISINENNPVEYNLKSDFVFPDMKLFSYNQNSNSWTESKDKINNKGNEAIENGRELYNTNCANCHPTQLSKKGTGPALGRVEKFRNLNWLIDFTSNSQAMIRSGDSISMCIYYAWNRSIMRQRTATARTR